MAKAAVAGLINPKAAKQVTSLRIINRRGSLLLALLDIERILKRKTAMSYRTIILVIATAMLLTACGDETVKVLKSPCVGIDNSPCGPKRPVNGQLNSAT